VLVYIVRRELKILVLMIRFDLFRPPNFELLLWANDETEMDEWAYALENVRIACVI
jgi:hypothetical protein